MSDQRPVNHVPAVSGKNAATLLQRRVGVGCTTLGLNDEFGDSLHDRTRGWPTRLAIGATDDPCEQEADRAAARALQAQAPSGIFVRPLARPTIARRASASAVSGRPAPASLANTLRAPGVPLDSGTRAFFEPRFGHDFSRVRVHHDEGAAASAHDVAARAYTVGHHLVFGRGRYVPGSQEGRQLIAHELAHVVQQRAAGLSAGTVWRAPEETDEPVDVDQEAWFAVEVTADPEHAGHDEYLVKSQQTGSVDMGTVYPGDLLVIRGIDENTDDLIDEATLALPPGLEQVGQTASGAVQIRVLQNATTGKALTIGLVDGDGHAHRLQVLVEQLPESPQAVNPEFSRIRQAHRSVRAQRRASRQKAGTDRRKVRGERRAERRGRRAEQRGERRALRRRAKAIRGEARVLRRSESCVEGTQEKIQAALQSAISAIDRSLGRLSASDALSDKGIVSALSRYMHWTPGDAKAPQTVRHLTRILDTLVVARNSMTLAVHGDFQCTMDCDETTGAFVRQGSRKRGKADDGVWVCPAWITGKGLRFPAANGLDATRAYALLHEFVHMSGPFLAEEDRFYVGRSDWRTLGAKETLGYADGYAALAWTLAESAEGK